MNSETVTTCASPSAEAPSPHPHRLVIEPPRGWSSLNLKEVWRYRELLYFLVWRDVKVRYKQTVLGASWAVIQPFFSMVVFTLFFGKLAKLPSDGIPYPIFNYTAMVPWTYFANALTQSGNSLVGNANLITKVYFPRLVVPASAALAGLVDFSIAFVVLIAMMFYFHMVPGWGILMAPVLLLLTFIIALGTGLWLSALNVQYRDIKYTIPFLVQLWMFASPIVYPLSMVPKKWRLIYSINPMSGIIDGFRAALLGKPFLWGPLAVSAAIGVALVVSGMYYFRRMERTFADVV